jgi:hypothetical protein
MQRAVGWPALRAALLPAFAARWLRRALRAVAVRGLQFFQRVDVAEGGIILEQDFGHAQRLNQLSMRRSPLSR